MVKELLDILSSVWPIIKLLIVLAIMAGAWQAFSWVMNKITGADES